MQSIVLIGAGGHCRSIIDSIVEAKIFKIEGIIDEKLKKGDSIYNIPVIGADFDLPSIYTRCQNAFVCVGSIGDISPRYKIYKMLKDIGFITPNIFDKTAIISSFTDIGEGIYIGKNAIVNAGSKIYNMAIINSNVVVEHDCIVNEYCHIATSATLCGGVVIGENSHIGAGAVIIQNKSIGKNTIIGAGSVVISDISSNCVAVGNPCKKIKEVIV